MYFSFAHNYGFYWLWRDLLLINAAGKGSSPLRYDTVQFGTHPTIQYYFRHHCQKMKCHTMIND